MKSEKPKLLELIAGDARHIPLPDESVQCVVTSPPYWGLRKYAGEQELVWGGKEKCEHLWSLQARKGISSGMNQGNKNENPDGATNRPVPETQNGICARCGAWRGGYGLEPTIEMYVAHSLEILREIRRVLRKDGVLFWNIGDSYAANGDHADKSCNQRRGKYNLANRPEHEQRNFRARAPKPKDLCLIPERIALAAQADGWWVRSRILWAKANPMPESVRDRPTDAAEHIWMFTKSGRYFWDAEAVREPHEDKQGIDRFSNGGGVSSEGFKGRTDGLSRPPLTMKNREYNPSGRNMRSVWAFATQPYRGAHFATFPEEIPRRAILAATSAKGACAQCGKPWERVTRPSAEYAKYLGKTIVPHDEREDERGKSVHPEGFKSVDAEYQTIGWTPGCRCRAQRGRTVPCLVLDPFGGSCTTGKVALELGRRAALVDIAYSDAPPAIAEPVSSRATPAKPSSYRALAEARLAEVQLPLLLE